MTAALHSAPRFVGSHGKLRCAPDVTKFVEFQTVCYPIECHSRASVYKNTVQKPSLKPYKMQLEEIFDACEIYKSL